MRRRMTGLVTVLGTLIAVGLPLVTLAILTQVQGGLPAVAVYEIDFVAAVMAAHIGIALKSGSQPWYVDRWLGDAAIAAIAGLAAWGAEWLAMRQGGLATDPALLALITTYILLLWAPRR